MTARAAALALAAALVGCSSGGDGGGVAPPSTVPVSGTTSVVVEGTDFPSPPTDPSTVPSSAPSSAPGSPAQRLCARSGTEELGVVAVAELEEASGLVASRTHEGVLWSHNDGADPRVFALGRDGADLGEFGLGGVEVDDLEDIALVPGADGDDLLLGDIGDNRARRASVRTHRLAEPDPTDPAPITDVTVTEYVYPDGAHNAETLLVDGDRIVIVTKEQERGPDGEPDEVGATSPSFVFEGPLRSPDGGPVELIAAGTLDTVRLEERTGGGVPHPATLLGFGGVPTGGDVAATGDVVVLRTYEAVWAWDRRPGQRVADVFAGDPCEVTSVLERQGEAVALTGDGVVTLGEGSNPPLHALGR